MATLEARKRARAKYLKTHRVQVTCEYCGDTVDKPYRTKPYRFCSKRCKCLALPVNTKSGPDNPNWKGGLSFIARGLRATREYQKWRKEVFERDSHTCMGCGQVGGRLHAHHIEHFSKNAERRLDIKNGTTLCVKCHSQEHPNLNIIERKKYGLPITSVS